MVSERRNGDREPTAGHAGGLTRPDQFGADGRAQLILVGAVTIALVILGLSVILNTVIFTETVSSAEAGTQFDEAREFDYEARSGVGRLILRLNHRHRNLSESDLTAVVDANVTDYSRAYTESYASSRGVVANLSYNAGNTAFGRRVVQAGDGELNPVTGPTPDWSPVPASQRRTVGWFSMNVDVRDTSTSAATITVSNGSESVAVELYRVGSESAAQLNVSTDVSFAGETTVTCDPSQGRVLLNLLEGQSVGGDCQFNGTGVLAPPYDVTIQDGSNVVAKYGLVINDGVTTGDYGPCSSSGSPPAKPCESPVVWTANATVEYVGSEIRYTNTDNVTIYREAP